MGWFLAGQDWGVGSWGSPQSSDSGNGYFTSKDVDHWMKMLNKI